jgi:hypothetical protein
MKPAIEVLDIRHDELNALLERARAVLPERREGAANATPRLRGYEVLPDRAI